MAPSSKTQSLILAGLTFLSATVETLGQKPGPTNPVAVSTTPDSKRAGSTPTTSTGRKAYTGSPIVTWAEQGWTPEQREFYHYTSQGTVLMPIEWFMALEQPPTDAWDLLNPFSKQPLLSNP